MNTTLEYEAIRLRYGGDDEPPRFIIHRHNLILALCLRLDFHRKIYSSPAEVWIEAGETNEEWGNRLAFDSGLVPVYLSPELGEEFRPAGLYEVLGSTEDPVELAQRMAFPNIERLSRVVFLKRREWV